MRSIIIRPNDVSAFLYGRDPGYQLPYRDRGSRSHLNGLPPNRRQLVLTRSYLHCLSAHATKSVRQRWRQAADRFDRQHTPVVFGRTTARFHNRFTAGSWL